MGKYACTDESERRIAQLSQADEPSVQPLRLNAPKIRGGMWALPTFHPEIPTTLTTGATAMFARCALGLHEAGFKLPEISTFVAVTNVVDLTAIIKNQLHDWCAHYAPTKEAPQIDVEANFDGRGHCTITIGAVAGRIPFYLLEETLDEIFGLDSSQEWAKRFAWLVLERADSQAMRLYSPWRTISLSPFGGDCDEHLVYYYMEYAEIDAVEHVDEDKFRAWRVEHHRYCEHELEELLVPSWQNSQSLEVLVKRAKKQLSRLKRGKTATKNATDAKHRKRQREIRFFEDALTLANLVHEQDLKYSIFRNCESWALENQFDDDYFDSIGAVAFIARNQKCRDIVASTIDQFEENAQQGEYITAYLSVPIELSSSVQNQQLDKLEAVIKRYGATTQFLSHFKESEDD